MTNAEQGFGSPTGLGTDVAERPGTPSTGGSDAGMKEQVQDTAQTAAEQGKKVAGTAADEASRLAQEGKDQAMELLGEAREQLAEQSRVQRDNLVGTLNTLSEDLDRMSRQAEGLASDLVRQAAGRVRGITSRLDGREPAELLDDVRDFARRRPGTFLLGALAAGVVAGRFARGAQKAHSDGPTAGGSVPTQRASQPVATSAPATPTAAHRATPEAAATATFPADQPGTIS